MSKLKQIFSLTTAPLKWGAAASLVGSGGVFLATSLPISADNDVLATAGGAVRFLRSLGTGMAISIDYFFSMLGLSESQENYQFMMGRIHQRAADRILGACLKNGGSYIKLGQGLVSMNHILPKEYTETLKALQDKCLARKDDEVTKIFQQDLGKTPCEVFKTFESAPIAAASLAQVFKAETQDGRKVAVKVQYIDLQRRFKSDVATIDFLLKLVCLMHPSFNFTWVLKDLKDSLKQELDFVNEGKNAERCEKDLKHLGFIYVPQVLWTYSSKRILVTEFVEGIKISEVDQLKQAGISLADLDTKLFLAFGEQIFQTGFVHADPHPGNVFVRKRKGKTEIILLDHGLYQEISQTDRIALSHFWKAIILNNHVDLKKYALQLGVSDYEQLAEILTQAPLRTHKFQLKIKLSEQDLQYMTEFAKSKFDTIIRVLRMMPRSLILVIRNLNTIRAIAHEHGDPINRYSILARAATKTAFKTEGSVLRKIWNFPTLLIFEIRLQ